MRRCYREVCPLKTSVPEELLPPGLFKCICLYIAVHVRPVFNERWDNVLSLTQAELECKEAEWGFPLRQIFKQRSMQSGEAGCFPVVNQVFVSVQQTVENVSLRSSPVSYYTTELQPERNIYLFIYCMTKMWEEFTKSAACAFYGWNHVENWV